MMPRGPERASRGFGIAREGRVSSVNRFQAGSRLRGRRATAALALTLVWLAGCSQVKVYRRSVLERADVSPARATSGPEDLIRQGMVLDGSDPGRAIACFRDAALKALPPLLAGGVSSDPDPGSTDPTSAQAVYSRAIEYAVLTAHRVAQNEGLPWPEVLARQGIAIAGQVGAFGPSEWSEALPTRCFEVAGFNRLVIRGGLGAPLVLTRHQSEVSNPNEQYYPRQVFKAATALLRPSQIPGGPTAILELHDPVIEPDMLWSAAPGAASLPMAYDMTTPLGRQFANNKLDLVGTLGVLFPSEFDSKTGLYMLDPYQPGKIPVVFVHGLNSSPEAWTNAMNELRGNPELRKRYQFWLFFYSTGNPILVSGSRLRTALTEIRTKFDPERHDPALDDMVLIGHSMGGLLSRLSISTSGSKVWEAASQVPPEQVNLDPDLKAKLVRALFFEPVPSVGRVIFVSTPHKGSPLGYEFVGRLVSSLIRLPNTMTDVSRALIQANGSLAISPAFRDRRQMTGVAQLSPNSAVLRVMNALPLAPNVPYHSIVGFNGQGSLPEGGDGVVPYTSAHVEGALSELVVASDHSAQEREASIDEMQRILHLHLREHDAQRQLLALGQPSVNLPTRPDGATPVRYNIHPPWSRTLRSELKGGLTVIGVTR